MSDVETRDLALVPGPVDVVVGANPTQQVVLVEASIAQGLPGPQGPVGPPGPPGALPPPVPADLGEAMMIRDQGAGPVWVIDRVAAADVSGLGALATLSSVNTAQITDGAVTSAKLANGAVGGAQLAANSVGASQIIDGSVGTAELGPGIVTQANLAAGSVGTAQLIDANVTNVKLAAGSVGTAQLIDANVTAAKLAAGVAATNLGFVPLNPASNLSELTNVVTARTNLGLGTAATQNTGTSGATVPLLNGANTWSAAQSFAASAAGAEWRGISVQNTAAYAAGASAQMGFQPAAGSEVARIGGYSDGAASATGLRGIVSSAGNGIVAFAFNSVGALNLGAAIYRTAGYLVTDALGNITSAPNAHGTWAPTITAGSYSIAYSNQVGRYVRIGPDLIYMDCLCSFTPSGTAGAGNVLIGGLPVNLSGTEMTSEAGLVNTLAGGFTGITPADVTATAVPSSATQIRFLWAAGTANITVSNLTTGTAHTIGFAGIFRTWP